MGQIFARYGIWGPLALGLIVRLVILWASPEPMVSDALAYVHMADTLVHGVGMTDTFGQYAFYSPGYPLILAGPFALFGSSLAVAQAVNLICALALIALVFWLTRAVSDAPVAPWLAALMMALWIPNAVGVATVAKENLSTPLLVGFGLLVVWLPRSRRPLSLATGAGLIYGFSLLVGGSVVLTAVGLLVALLMWDASPVRRACAFGLFALGALLPLIPWLVHVKAALGVVTLSTNAPFNLYLGNNPRATGWFLSIMDTPLGPRWHQLSAQLGEAGTAAMLQHEAISYIIGHPLACVTLGIKKLWFFWLPKWPDLHEWHAAPKLAVLRGIETVQFLLVVGLAVWTILTARLNGRARGLLVATIASFWLIHAVTYIIPRYREPVMPLMIVLAAVGLCKIVPRTLRA